MINSVQLKNFGPLTELDWQNLGQINLVIGNNGCGKSFLLKALYSAVRTLEDYKRGDNPDSAAEILADKLFWTFQAEKIGDLVNKKAESPLAFELIFDDKSFSYSFGKDTTKVIHLENIVTPRADNSIYLPAKEVLSLFHVILDSREHKKQFGFDDTYFDLAKALQVPISSFDSLIKAISDGDITMERTFSGGLIRSDEILKNIIGGFIRYDETAKRWHFIKNNESFSMGATAEGVKKIAILYILLNNGYLSENSIIFIDEPESALHPEAISKLLDIIAILAKHGIQFFMASHSYFVIKKLFLIAQEQKLSIPILSYENGAWQQSNLKDEMPDNPIIDESIKLYKEEINLPA